MLILLHVYVLMVIQVPIVKSILTTVLSIHVKMVQNVPMVLILLHVYVLMVIQYHRHHRCQRKVLYSPYLKQEW